MNFLAHLYLTKDLSEEISIGNFIADSVKGKKSYAEYPPAVQTGIDIHREIDQFSDLHPMFRVGTKRLHGAYGKYASIIMDIYYDHILALNWNDYHSLSLHEFATEQYCLIERQQHHLPEFTRYWFEIMKKDNLLYAYASESGIDDVLKRMDHRTDFISGMGNAIHELRTYKTEFQKEFITFFEDMQSNLKNKFPELWP
jgi:acyl carrier protein phosphodiesterase